MKRNSICALAVVLLALGCSAAIKLSGEAIDIPVGGGTTFWFYYPEVKVDGDMQRPSKVDVSGGSATLTYKHGAKIALEATEDHVAYRFLEVPSSVSEIKHHLVMPTGLGAKGAQWTIGAKTGAYPTAKTGGKLFQGQAGDFAAAWPEARFALLFPETFAWTELQDLRQWNWDGIGVKFVTPFNADKRIVVIPFGKEKSALAAIRAKVESSFFAQHGNAAPKIVSSAKPSLSASLSTYGLEFNLGSMGQLALSHPWLKIDGTDRVKPLKVTVAGDSALIEYKNNGRLTATQEKGKVRYAFERKPDGYQNPFCELFVPFNFNQGGRWRVDATRGEFPATRTKTKLYQGGGATYAVSDPNGAELQLTFSPSVPWIELQDNREWNWNIYWTGLTLQGGLDAWTVDFALDVNGFRQKMLADKFGQVSRAYPGKIRDEQELKDDAKTEVDYYASLDWAGKMAKKGLKPDAFGGLEGTGAKLKLKKTGFFHVEKKTIKGKARWLLVDPVGNAFFHLGVCSFCAGEDYTDVTGRQGGFEWLPPHDATFGAAWKDRPGDWWNSRAVSFYKANVIRKYGAYDDNAMCARHIDRVRAVGFNSVGAFSPIPAAVKEKNFPYVEFVPLGKPIAMEGVRGFFDPFDERSVSAVKAAMKSVAKTADDPLLIGRFLANEQGLEDLPRALPRLGKDSAAKREFVKRLEKQYGSITKFNAAWGTAVADFASATSAALPVTTKAAFTDVKSFAAAVLEEYYALIAREFRANDPNHLLIGNRWQPGTANNEDLCRIAGKYMDVISINYYTSGIDAAFMKRLYDWTGGKPQMWSEFYYTATKESNNGPGNDLATQRLRGAAYRNYVEGAAALGFVVGIEWFTLIDQAATGRFFEGQNGERANTGLFSVLDRPYKDLLAEMLQAHLDLYPVWFGAREPWTIGDPRFSSAAAGPRAASAGHPIAPIAVDGQQKGYPLRPPERIPSSRLVMGREAEGLEASFKSAWDKDYLYLLVEVTDATPMCNKNKGEWLWSGDALEIFVGTEEIDQGGPMLFSDRQIVVGCAANDSFYVPKVAEQPKIKSAVTRRSDGKGYIAEVHIPWSALGGVPKEDATILFDLGIDDAPANADRRAQLMWSGTSRNSSDRSSWGRLTLVP